MGETTNLKNVLLISVFLVVTTCSIAAGKTIYVDDDGPADFNNIQAAIDDASHGDIIIVNPGIYTDDGNRDIDYKGKAITVRSMDPNDPNIVAATVIDCNGTEAEPHRGFYFHSGEGQQSVLAGLMITNGYGPDGKIWDDSPAMNPAGGAIFCENSSPTINSCIVTDNYGYFGAGLFIGRSSPLLNNCTIRSNGGSNENAIFCEHSSPIIRNCNITDNGSRAISCYKVCSPVITGCIISENGGYGISGFYKSNLTITDCLIAGNQGRGIWCFKGTVSTISRCTISNNSSGHSLGFDDDSDSKLYSCIISSNPGGAIVGWEECDITIKNCSICNNGGDGSGNGILSIRSGCNMSLANCIVWDNNGLPIDLHSGSTLQVSYSDVEGGLGEICPQGGCEIDLGPGNMVAEPLLDSNYNLSALSPCINTGDPNYTAVPGETDIRGEPRVINGRIDIGANEFNNEGPTIHISPHRLELSAPEGGSIPETHILFIRNSGPGTMNWRISKDCPWLQVAPATGECSSEVDDVLLSFNISGLAQGIHSAQLLVCSENAINSPLIFTVVLRILDGDGQLHVPSEYLTIQAAIDHADGDRGDTVIVADGIYRANGNRDIDFKGKAITVRSENGPENCIIDCNGTEAEPHRGFHFHSGEDGNSVLDGFTVANGHAPICVDGSRYYGGAVFCDKSNPIITNCTFVGNTARWIGLGGAVSNHYSNPVILDCKFVRNSTEGDGGAMYNYESSPVIINSIFTTNSTSCWGGAIRNVVSSGSIANCLFVTNTGPHNGGAISNWSSTPNITNCTFTENSSADGAAIWSNEFSSLTIENSIIWSNEGPEISGNETDVSYSDIEGGWPGEGNINVDPFFVEPGYRDANGTPYDPWDDVWVDGDYHLLPDSPCINAGDPDYIPEPNETDLDGKPRIIGVRIDMGAYEFNHIPVSDAGPDQTVEAQAPWGATVTLDGSGSSDADSTPGTNDDIVYFDWYKVDPCDPNADVFLGTGQIIDCNLPIGEHIILLEVIDKAGAYDTNEVTIIVQDTTPPQFQLSVAPTMLWPPDHKMVLITPSWTVSDECDASPDVSLVGIVANEGDDTIGDGHTSNDIQIGEDGSIYLRAERSGTASDRVYTITYRAVDDCGNRAESSASVTVPHDQR